MKTRKKVLCATAIILCIFCLLVTGCTETLGANKNDYMFYNGNQSIGYGSSQEEIQQVFGSEAKDALIGEEYGIATVIFREGKVVYLLIRPEDAVQEASSLWRTSKGVGIGSTELEVQKAYLLSDAEKVKGNTYNIPLKAKDSELVKCASNEAEYYLSFMLKDSVVNEIGIYDVMAATRFQ